MQLCRFELCLPAQSAHGIGKAPVEVEFKSAVVHRNECNS